MRKTTRKNKKLVMSKNFLAGELGKAFGAMISVLDRSLDSVSNDWLMVAFGHNQKIVTNPCPCPNDSRNLCSASSYTFPMLFKYLYSSLNRVDLRVSDDK